MKEARVNKSDNLALIPIVEENLEYVILNLYRK